MSKRLRESAESLPASYRFRSVADHLDWCDDPIAETLMIAFKVRFSSTRYSMTCCCLWFSQPARATARNENGSKRVRIGGAYHGRQFVLALRTTRTQLLDITGY